MDRSKMTSEPRPLKAIEPAGTHTSDVAATSQGSRQVAAHTSSSAAAAAAASHAPAVPSTGLARTSVNRRAGLRSTAVPDIASTSAGGAAAGALDVKHTALSYANEPKMPPPSTFMFCGVDYAAQRKLSFKANQSLEDLGAQVGREELCMEPPGIRIGLH